MTTRDQIVTVADQMFYQQGYENTSFADIANAIGISRGNFYYHFKTKDDILEAVIDRRLQDRKDMVAQWDADEESPEIRICKFIDILIVNGEKIKKFGCPIGTLSSELAKLNHPNQDGANALFGLFQAWLRHQFVALGREDDADYLATHLLARSQGVAMLANAFQDDEFIRREVEQMHGWVAAQAALPGRGNTRKLLI